MNARDVMLGFQTMPFKGINLTQATVDGAQQMSILSACKTVTREEDGVHTHVLDMFMEIHSRKCFPCGLIVSSRGKRRAAPLLLPLFPRH